VFGSDSHDVFSSNLDDLNSRRSPKHVDQAEAAD
jgi:hypothetical protein